MLEYRPHYKRHLPHYQPPGATLFVTFRLAGSLPRTVIEELLLERNRVEQTLDQIVIVDREPVWLWRPRRHCCWPC